ncbi:ankyrin repeat domain-containing protein [Neptuniibacter pectenicola]|uniref:Ankyrin repeat domain-containing protein n=1 Tax=Neptuniibacter pectenicola TaxID=1806669 RepID=A0ABU9TPQ8_9GAMM
MGWFTNKALFGGIKNRDYDTVRLALEKGANPNSYHHGFTPLMRACMVDDAILLKLLINAGADPEKKDKKGKFDTYEFCRENGWEGAIGNIQSLVSIRASMLKLNIDPSKFN